MRKLPASRLLAVPAATYKLRHLDCEHVSEWSRNHGVVCLGCALTAFGLTTEDFEDWLELETARRRPDWLEGPFRESPEVSK